MMKRSCVCTVLVTLLAACGGDPQTEESTTAAPTVPEACADDLTTATAEYLHYPGIGCDEATTRALAGLGSFHYRKACTEAADGSKPVRGQVVKCWPAVETNTSMDGSFVDVQLCCDQGGGGAPAAPVPETTFVARTLACPDGKVDAMATDLHFPGETSCATAADAAERSLEIAAYRRACAGATQASRDDRVLAVATARCRLDRTGAMVDVAVCCNADAPKRVASNTTDIWEALRTRDTTALQRLLVAEPALAEARDPPGVTLLHRATSVEIAKFLVSRGIDVNATDEAGQTPLHVAVSGRQNDLVEALIAMGAAVDAADRYGSRPLTHARTGALVRILLERGAEVDDGHALHAAAFYGASDAAKELIDGGADLEARDANGDTPLHRAVFRKQTELVRLLLTAGADANARNHGGRTPLAMANAGPIADLLRAAGGS